jgi:alanyl-tRNA synthetase
MVEALQSQLDQAAKTLKAQPEHLVRKLEQLVEERERLAARVAEMVKGGGAGTPQGKTLAINGVTVTLADSPAENRDEIAAMADAFRSGKTRAALILFGTGERAAVHVALTDDLVKAGRKAGDLVSRIAAIGGGKGGGRPHFASGSLGDGSRLAAAREAAGSIVQAWLEGS